MDLTNYNPNNDRGITTKEGVSGLRCLDGEDLCKLLTMSEIYLSIPKENQALVAIAERLAWAAVINLEQTKGTWIVR